MPKGFTQREKDIIKGKLIERGREFLSVYGVKKTSVEDLTKAVGISKGAFYVFYGSKEELFFEIFEEVEKEVREHVLGSLFKDGEITQESVKNLIKSSLEILLVNPLMKNFNKEELEYMVRKLPPEKLESHITNDDGFVVELYEILRGKKVIKECNPSVLSGLFRGLAYISFHKDGIGNDVYPEVVNLVADMVSNYLIEK